MAHSVSFPTSTGSVDRSITTHDPVWQAHRVLHAGFIVAPVVAGLDKFTHLLVDWDQYLAPVLQFVWGVFVVHEPMPPSRWIGFALVWLALAIFTFDAVRNRTRGAFVLSDSTEGPRVRSANS